MAGREDGGSAAGRRKHKLILNTELTKDTDMGIGVAVSVAAHCLLAWFMIYGPKLNSDMGKQTIYSVTIEGGKTLGGISQVPKDDKSQVAPPKKVSAPEEQKKDPPKKEEEKKPEPKKEKEKEADPKDAEISLKEKKEEEKKKEVKKDPPPKPEVKKPEAKKVEKPKEPTSAEVNKKLQQAMQRYLGESTDAGGKGFGAGALGGAGMGGGVVMPPEFFTYKRLLEQQVKGGWSWYDTSAAIIAEVIFEISPSGEISNVRISKSSGNSQFDDSVSRAVMKANPLPPPPAIVYQHFRSVRMYFDPRE